MSTIIHCAVVGLGRIGSRHATIIHQHPQLHLQAICDIKNKEVGAFDCAFYTQIEALLQQEPTVEVVCICTPNGLHAEQAILALDYKKHVLIEKPLALHKKDAEAIIFKALQVSRKVFCVMQNRYSPPAKWLKSVVDQGVLGIIYLVQINCYWNRDDRYYRPDGIPHAWHGDKALDGGTLFTQFSHFVDMLYWIFGDITNIQTNLKNIAHQHSIAFEDTGQVLFELVNGGMGVLNYTTAVWDKNMESSLTIIAENGSLKIGGQYMERVEYCHIKDYELPQLEAANPPNDYGTYKGSANNHGLVYENLVAVLTNDQSISTNALEGMKVVEMIERIYAA